MRYILPLLILLVLCAAGIGLAQTEPAAGDTTAVDTTAVIVPPAPVTNLAGRDKPDDNGHAVILTWDLSADDMTLPGGNQSVIQYEVFWWVPNYVDTLRMLQQRHSLIRAALDNWDRWPNQVRNAIEQVESGVTDRTALEFSPAMPSSALAVPNPSPRTLSSSRGRSGSRTSRRTCSSPSGVVKRCSST